QQRTAGWIEALALFELATRLGHAVRREQLLRFTKERRRARFLFGRRLRVSIARHRNARASEQACEHATHLKSARRWSALHYWRGYHGRTLFERRAAASARQRVVPRCRAHLND